MNLMFYSLAMRTLHSICLLAHSLIRSCFFFFLLLYWHMCHVLMLVKFAIFLFLYSHFGPKQPKKQQSKVKNSEFEREKKNKKDSSSSRWGNRNSNCAVTITPFSFQTFYLNLNKNSRVDFFFCTLPFSSASFAPHRFKTVKPNQIFISVNKRNGLHRYCLAIERVDTARNLFELCLSIR